MQVECLLHPLLLHSRHTHAAQARRPAPTIRIFPDPAWAGKQSGGARSGARDGEQAVYGAEQRRLPHVFVERELVHASPPHALLRPSPPSVRLRHATADTPSSESSAARRPVLKRRAVSCPAALTSALASYAGSCACSGKRRILPLPQHVNGWPSPR
jgi:hypothetical protein